jgi:hypothetical protein
MWYTWKVWRFAWAGGSQPKRSYNDRKVVDADGLWIWVARGLFWLRERGTRCS